MHASVSYALAGKAAWALYEKTGDWGWAQRSYQASKQSAEVREQTDPRKAAVGYAYAEKAARELAKKTKLQEWTEKAADCYRKVQELVTRAGVRYSRAV